MFPGLAEHRDQKETEDKTFFRRSQELRKGGKMSGLLKSISSIMIVFFMLISMSVTAFAENYRTAAVSAEVLNLRQNPTVSAMILCKLPKGVQVLITEERDGWYKVTVPVNRKELTG
jgi:cytochrome c oxidase assembly factor CtaG